MTFSKELLSAIQTTWEAIGSDVLEIDPEIDNQGALEMVLDASRLDSYGNSVPASLEYRDLVRKHGWVPLLEALSEAIQLV
jgi:hypothetical protein